jgi:mono/diheme cytochrome c family protein
MQKLHGVAFYERRSPTLQKNDLGSSRLRYSNFSLLLTRRRGKILEVLTGRARYRERERMNSFGRLVCSIIFLSGVSLWLWAQEPAKKTLGEPNRDAASSTRSASSTGLKIDFATEVFPLLQQRCFRCHGPEQQMGEYRLDAKQVALTGGLSAPNIIPGKSGESPLFQRVAGTGQLNPMPMAGERLKPAELALIRSWIDQGAGWPDDVGVRTRQIGKHWAYIRPARPKPPEIGEGAQVRNPIDNFVLARLQREGLAFAPETTKEALVRRVSLDLRGLPPTIEEVDRFLADISPKAYESLVDRMLSSPSFGEHWAQQWLDLSRYADTNGYESDEPRTMWAYRDWVIDAFNRNLSFDQFTIEQLAGDLLPNPSTDQLVATGFHRNTMVNNEAGAKDDEFRDAAVKDRVDTTATVWLGSTFGCAQCHDHKYDPFKQTEYYQLYAIFNNTAESAIKVSEEIEVFKGDQRELKRREAQVAALRKVLDTETLALRAAQQKWEERTKAKLPSFDQAWQVVEPLAMRSESGAVLESQPDGSVLVKGEAKTNDVYELEFKTSLENMTGLRLEALPDTGLPDVQATQASSKRFFLSDVEAEAWSASQLQEQSDRWDGKLEWGPWHTIGPFRTDSRSAAFSTVFPPETHHDPQEVYENGHLAWIKRRWKDGRIHYFRYLPDTPEENCSHYAFRTVEAKEAMSVTVSLGSFKGLKLWLNKELVFSTDPTRDIAPDQELVRLDLKAGTNEILIKGSNDEGPYGFYFQPYLGLQPKARIRFAAASADHSGWESIDLPGVLDGRKETGWATGQGGAVTSFQAAAPFGSRGGLLKVRLLHDSPEADTQPLRRFRISVTSLPSSSVTELRQTPNKLRLALAKPPVERAPEEARAVQDQYQLISPELAGTWQQYRKGLAELDAFKKQHSTTTLVMKELPEPRKTHRQNRGSFLDVAEPVEPGVPAVLHPIDRTQRINRLSFAQWLVSESNPLTARVRVNQIWLNLFGQGLVSTTEDFGSQGDAPTHPELLDWLATEFIRLGWDTKALLKTIVTSTTYRQSSEVSPEKHEKDPENKLLSRGARYRLRGETVRDVALACSNLLSRKMGGPSVFPPQPAAVFAEHFIEGGFKQWPTSVGEDRYRRGLYTFYKRTLVYPTFATFDGPDRTVCTVKRTRSNTPLQALDTLNDPVFFEAAGSLAQRLLTEAPGDTEDRLAYAFRLVFARKPTTAEAQRLQEFYGKMRTRYQKTGEAEKVVAAAFPDRKPLADKIELPAWIMVANALLNLDEAVTRE